ncbi:TSUP family transporter [Saccharopolyspora erythraea]|uniref:TSUP family transporter n=1 Tax=Saccharopolyspora erythraea TaxID=1836 RepID=UPI0002F6FC9F|nr:TSUP family transporter [Saccharopolyspora erythraea]
MSIGFLVLVAVAVAAAAFVQGATGVGFALIVAPVVGLVEPSLLPVLLLVLMIPLNLYVAGRERGSLDRTGAGWITAGRFAGTFGGLWVLAAIPLAQLNLLVGGSTVLPPWSRCWRRASARAVRRS